MSFEELVTKIQSDLKPMASYLVYRAQFIQRKLKESESVTEFIAVLKDIAEKFKLTDMEEQVMDRLVIGLRHHGSKIDILMIEIHTLVKATKAALASEIAFQGACSLREDTGNDANSK